MGEGETKQTHVGGLKVGSYVIMGDAACIVKSVQVSRPGKHGHAKCRIESVGIIDGQKRIEVYPSHDPILVPIIGKKAAQVLSVSGKMANIMDLETYETFDLPIPEELEGQITEGGQVVYWEIMGQRVIKQVK